MEDADHLCPVQTSDRGVGHRGDRRDAEGLPGQTSLAKEIAGTENGDDRLLAVAGDTGDLDLSLPDVEQRIGRIALREDHLSPTDLADASAFADAGEKRLWIERAGTGRHGALPAKLVYGSLGIALAGSQHTLKYTFEL